MIYWKLIVNGFFDSSDVLSIQDTGNFKISGNLMGNGIELCNDVFWLILDVEKNLDLTSRALNYDIP